ncbi:MAG: ABC transporter substrate-binding protein [Carbonactinosporaceae bacterium]
MVTGVPRRPQRALAGTACALLLLAACGGGEQTAESANGKIPVTFAASAGASSTGLVASVIKGEGLDAKHGLNMKVSEFAPDQAEQALLTGQVDTGFFGIISLAKVRSEGHDLTFMAPLQTNHGDVIVPAESQVKHLEQLRGQKIATLNPVSGLYTTMQVLAAEIGLSWEEDFNVISAPPPALVAFIEKNEVDGIVHFEPTTSQLLASGKYRSVMNLSEAWQQRTGRPLLMLGLAAEQSWIDENPEAARRLTATLRDATRLLSTDQELMANYLERFGLEPEVVDTAKQRMAKIYITESAAKSAADARLILKRARELGIISEVPEPIFVSP